MGFLGKIAVPRTGSSGVYERANVARRRSGANRGDESESAGREKRLDAARQPDGMSRRNFATEVEQGVTQRAVLGAPGRAAASPVAQGDGWRVEDVVCTWGPGDRPFEERHSGASIALVLAGTFQYRFDGGSDLLTPGSFMLGNDGQCFECGHEHAAGDRCLAFRFSVEYFDEIAAAVGVKAARRHFRAGRLPPLRQLTPIATTAAAGLIAKNATPWDELALEVAARVLRAVNGATRDGVRPTRAAEARVTEAVREIERNPAAAHSLQKLAADAAVSPFHFLRTFQRVAGVTPHQFILRTRLRAAALRLASEPAKVIDIAFNAGFGDLSNFNHAFRAEFGTTPRRFRERAGRRRRIPA